LVAEEITTRFFNVVQLLSNAVPIVGIQANIVQVGDVNALHFTTIINSYQEPEEEEDFQPASEKYWLENYPVARECARWYRDLLARICGDVFEKFGKSVITLYVDGLVRAAVWPKKNDRAWVTISKLNEGDLAQAEEQLNREGVPFFRKGDQLKFDVTVQQLKEKQGAHEWIAKRLAPQHLINEKN
jgi:hypothetical protein